MKIIHTKDGRTLYKDDQGHWLDKNQADKLLKRSSDVRDPNKDAQIAKNKEEAAKKNRQDVKTSRVPLKQLEIENKIRSSEIEHLYYLDAVGNEILSQKGISGQEVSFDPKTDDENRFNRYVEQAIWNGKDIHVTHNHTEDIIFSDSDIESFTALEAKSLSATIPNGGAYRLIREQPVSQGTDPRGVEVFKADGTVEWRKDFTSKFSPKLLAREYAKAYRSVWDDQYEAILKSMKYGSAERERDIQKLVAESTKVMTKWLEDNAADYGFSFIME